MRGGGEAPRGQRQGTLATVGDTKGKVTLRTRAEAQAYIVEHKITHLVAYEFSGSVLRPLRQQGVQAMSCDKRPAEHGGPHYEGDLLDIIDLQMWDAIFFVGPDCYQHLRHDRFCLKAKIADGRAYWGGAKVLWCICCPFARMLLVEQPDTIGHDYMDLESLPGVNVVTMRTSEVGDKSDKFMRFTLVNAALPIVKGPRRRPTTPRRSHLDYADVEEQCRDRSTWAHHPETSELVALMLPIDPRGALPRHYGERIKIFKKNWEDAGHVAPPNWDDPRGKPPSEDARQYQLERGMGDPSRRLPGAKEAEVPTVKRAVAAVDRPGTPASGARRAEPGDQVVASDLQACAASLIQRKKRLGDELTPEQARCWERLTQQVGARQPQPKDAGARAGRPSLSFGPEGHGQQPSGLSIGAAFARYEREVLLPVHKRLVDVYGQGNCGFNAIAYSNGLAGGTKLTGAELRQRCKQHATLLLASVEDWAPNLDVREMLTTSMGGWDLDELRGEAPSAEALSLIHISEPTRPY